MQVRYKQQVFWLTFTVTDIVMAQGILGRQWMDVIFSGWRERLMEVDLKGEKETIELFFLLV